MKRQSSLMKPRALGGWSACLGRARYDLNACRISFSLSWMLFARLRAVGGSWNDLSWTSPAGPTWGRRDRRIRDAGGRTTTDALARKLRNLLLGCSRRCWPSSEPWVGFSARGDFDGARPAANFRGRDGK